MNKIFKYKSITAKDEIKNFLKGIAIGTSMLVPGVSGGTMAIILGIYDKLLSAVGNILKNFKSNILFLLTVFAGGLFGVIAFSGIVLWLSEKYKIQVMYFFIGAILGSVPLLLKKAEITPKKIYNIIFAFIGTAISVLLLFLPSSAINTVPCDLSGTMILFFCGTIISVAMILPGISTSQLLLVMGLYESVLSSFQQMNLYFLFLLALGVIVGTLLFTKFLDNMMKKFPDKSYMMIAGFVIGSVFDVFPGVPKGIFEFILCAAVFSLGFSGAMLMSKIAK